MGRALDGISGSPLMLDEEPRLGPLFVEDAGPFRTHIESFDARLASNGYMETGPSVGNSSLVFRVIGPQGSGKSTLANLLVGRLKKYAENKALRVFKRDLKPRSLNTDLETLYKEAKDAAAEGCCLILEDVRLEMEDEIHELFEVLRKTMAVVLFEIVHDASDIRARRLSARVYPQELKTDWLTPTHAAAFVSTRISLFRAPAYADDLAGDLAGFPFDVERVGAVISHAGGAEEMLTLRMLNRVLDQAIDQERRRRGTEPPIAGLGPDALRERIIDLQAVYARVIGEAGGIAA